MDASSSSPKELMPGILSYGLYALISGVVVNVVNGNLVKTEVDVNIKSRGPGFFLARTCNSQSKQAGLFGKSWTSNLDMRIEKVTLVQENSPEQEATPAQELLCFYDGDGSIVKFKRNEEGKLTPPLGFDVEVIQEGGGVTKLIFKDRTQLLFREDGRLVQVRDRLGNGLTFDYQFELGGKRGIITLTDSLKRTCRIGLYRGKAKYFVNYFSDFVGRTWTYSYERGFLTKVCDPEGVVIQYKYSSGCLVSIFCIAEGKRVSRYQFLYDLQDRLMTVIAAQKTTTLVYASSKGEVRLTDSAEAITDFYIDKNKHLARIIENPNWLGSSAQETPLPLFAKDLTGIHFCDEKGNAQKIKNDSGEIFFLYHKKNLSFSFTRPALPSMEYIIDASGNIITCIDADGRSDAREYDDFGNLLTWTEQLALANNFLPDPCFQELDPDSDPSTHQVEFLKWKQEIKEAGNRDTNQADDVKKRGTIQTDKMEKRNGECSIRLTPRKYLNAGEPGWLVLMQIIFIPLKYRNQKFILSGEIKATQLKGRAFFCLEGLKENRKPIRDMMGDREPIPDGIVKKKYHSSTTGKQLMVENGYSSITGTQDWTRRQLSLWMNQKMAYLKVFLIVCHEQDSNQGCAWFDHLQLVIDKVSSPYNPLKYGWKSFRYYYGEEVRELNDGELSDKQEVMGDGISIRLVRHRTDEPSIQLYQESDFCLNPVVPITFTVLCKTKGVEGGGANQSVQLEMGGVDDQGRLYRQVSTFLPGTHSWQRVCATIYPASASIKVFLLLRFAEEATGTIWFSSPRLILADVCTRVRYDKDSFLPLCIKAPQQPSIHIHLSYDERGNLTDYRRVRYNEDSFLPVCITDPLSYDERGNLADYHLTSYSYDVMDRLQHVVDGQRLASYQYHVLGLLSEKSLTYQNIKQTTRFTYDDYFRLERITDAMGHWIQFTYMQAEEVSQIKYSDGTTRAYRYDKKQQLVEEKRDGQLRFQYEYDMYGNMIKVKDRYPLSLEREFSYEPEKNVTRLISKDGIIRWFYDKGECRGIDVINREIVYTFLYESHGLRDPSLYWYYPDYDGNGYISTLIQGNGSGASYTYTQDGLLLHLSLGKRNGEVLEKWNMEYDTRKNPILLQDHQGREVTYSYDDKNQLIQEHYHDINLLLYTYDAFGNRQREPEKYRYEYNLLNQLTLVTEIMTEKQTRYLYDQRGNLIKDGKYTYHWNPANQLSEVRDKTNGQVIATHLYDEQGRRTCSQIQGMIRFFIYDGDSYRVLYETNEQHQILCYYMYGECGRLFSVTFLSTTHEWITWMRKKFGITEKGLPNGTYFYHTNHRGDVLAVTNTENDIVARYRYDAWGNILEMSGPFAKLNPYRYASYRYDDETGLYYLMARYYDPQHGRFISKDPNPGELDDLLSQHGYTYAYNNPMVSIDRDWFENVGGPFGKNGRRMTKNPTMNLKQYTLQAYKFSKAKSQLSVEHNFKSSIRGLGIHSPLDKVLTKVTTRAQRYLNLKLQRHFTTHFHEDLPK
jgi:RHS repeat-associated protein